MRRHEVGTSEVAVESYVESQRLRAVLFERRTTQSDRRIVADVVAAKEENFLWFPETE